jgi:hypothetical protein
MSNQPRSGLRQVLFQAIITATTAATTCAAFSSQTRYVRLGVGGGAVTDSAKYYVTGVGGTTAYSILPSGSYETIGVTPGSQLTITPTGTAVIVSVTELE